MPQSARRTHPLPAWLSRALATLLDPTIVFSFDRTGYWLHSGSFRPDDLEVDLAGRICLVTGANSGLGFETARELARRGGEVWLLCRDAKRGQAALEQIQQEQPNARLQLELLDVSDLAMVRSFAERFPRDRIDVLVNNAGILPETRRETAQGIEMTWATNVLGPFLLTQLLLPRLRAAGHATGDARVITVSSGGMYPTRLSLDDVESSKGKFSGVRAYSLTKRAQVVLNELWAERCAGSGITFSAMHPGWVDTAGIRSSLPGFHQLLGRRLRTPAQGADTIVWLAVCERSAGLSGKFWFDRHERCTHYLPWTRESPAQRDQLWELCVEQTER
ncbi:SDR family NAD(P)-dependent oxidoreductase [Anatilimnocola sp. NA78]|uniref:SDR family NAD(P)-dependent oxidoreductase n=1 Tax=Anatilimnocola sp. NA78 TaxID=3415683 RepID=UPI003CE51BE4